MLCQEINCGHQGSLSAGQAAFLGSLISIFFPFLTDVSRTLCSTLTGGKGRGLLSFVQGCFPGAGGWKREWGGREDRAEHVCQSQRTLLSWRGSTARTASRQRRVALQKLTCGQTPGRAESCWLGHSRGILYLEGDRAVPCYPPGLSGRPGRAQL